MPPGPAKEVNVARAIETGAIGGALVVVLVVSGSLLSPSVALFAPQLRFVQAAANVPLYVLHLSSATLLVTFTVWHLLPLGHSFSRKKGVAPWAQVASYAVLALLVVQVATGLVLWLNSYELVEKRIAVLVHLVNAFVILAPLAVHAWRGARVWRGRREARQTALTAAAARGRADVMLQRQRAQGRRVFLRMAAYAVAGAALAGTFARFTAGQVLAWRLNFVGETPVIQKGDYRLRVTGLVSRPIELGYDELLKLPVETVRFTHHCVEGWTYTDDWTGTRLVHVLDKAGGLLPAAAQLVFRSPEVSKQGSHAGERYDSNFPATDLDDVWVIWGVGGGELPPEHGYPVRLMSPRKWGYKATKWLTEIHATDDAAYRGYWERQGYHPRGDYPGPIFG